MDLMILGVVAVLFSCGTYLLLHSNLVQIIIGMSLFSHGTNLALLLSGGLKRGGPPLLSTQAPYTDLLPQALVLTAIVISFGMTPFAVVLAYRTKQVCRSNEVEKLAGGEE